MCMTTKTHTREYIHMTLESKKWKISGTLVFNKGDGLIRQWAASDVFYDRISETWKVFCFS